MVTKSYEVAMTSKDLEEAEKKIEEAKAKYTTDALEIERNLTEYLNITDPIVRDGKVIALVKRPTMKQLKAIVPEEMAKYGEDPSSAPRELQEKYSREVYKIMSELIVTPKYTPEEWVENSNPWFIQRFFLHLSDTKALLDNLQGF